MTQDVPTRSLLIVEDEPELREILYELCESLGANTLCVSDGLAADEVLKTHRFDTIISDISMPRMSGLELIAKLRRSGCETPVIFLTAYCDEDNMAQALTFGATEFVPKPFDGQKFLQLVKLTLELGSALNELDSEIEFFNQNSMIPAQKVFQVKNARRALWNLKSNDIIKNKNDKTVSSSE